MTIQRISQIDLMKLICAFFVVTIHIVMSYRVQENVISTHVLFLESFLRCCIPVFFMCSGYFMFSKSHSTKHMYRKLFFNLVFPTLTIVFLLFVFNDFIENKKSLLECIQSLSPDNVIAVIQGLLNWNFYDIRNTFYLWFMISLIKIYIAYPVLKLLCVNSSERNTIRRLVIFLCGISEILFPTIEAMSNYTVTLYGYSIFGDYSFFYILFGYELYLFFQKETIRKSWSIYGLSAYIAGSLITYFSTIFIDIGVDNAFDQYFFDYNTLGAFISGMGLFMFIRNLNISNPIMISVVSFLGRHTFVLYLVHYIIIKIMTCYEGMHFLEAHLPRPIFYFISPMLCYCLSLLISLLLWQIKEMAARFFHHSRTLL